MTGLTGCRQCARLAAFLDQVKTEFPDYHNKPVPAFGADDARLLIVGLAPGKHGANASGRPFTGDAAGQLLFETMHRYGFANRAQSRAVDDGLELIDCRISNAVKCLPPDNKPNTDEINRCNQYLALELDQLPLTGVILALGQIAHVAILKALGLKRSDYRFAHGAEFELPNGLTLIDSYHCSRYNTQTRRLTPDMFRQIFLRIQRRLIDEPSA
ncbi:MAG: uracil-DNA glycosylase [Gammaproteobacteria bacterium]|nr:uracil-DNA glycosylase [Gammaproteobacteria bacterium]